MKTNTNRARLLLLLLFAVLMPFLASAQTKVGIDEIWYNLDESSLQAEVTSGDAEYSGSISIPATITHEGVDYSVTSIGDYAFSDCSGLTAIIIPEGVTSIKEGAFYYCNELTSITLPEGMMNIGESAFCDCHSLISIIIPEGVTSIGGYAFYNCHGLISIIIPEGVTSIGGYAFYNCNSLANVYSHSEVVPSIDRYAFDAFNIKNTTLRVPANSLETYKETAVWKNFGKFESLEVKAKIDGIWYNISAWKKLAEVTYQGSSYDEYSNEYAGSITIPSMIIYDGVNCSVTNIGEHAFWDCPSLTSITFSENSQLTNIGEGAFVHCTGINSINIPESVTSIEGAAFSWCTNLTDINIPKSVTNIGNVAFSSCKSLSEITIPEGVTSIESGTFQECTSLTSITIPERVTSIGEYAFLNCNSLTAITCNAVNPPKCEMWTFKELDKSIPLYVPAGSVEAYQSAEYWREFTNIKPLANKYTLTVSAARHATLYLDYAVEIPDGVEVFYASSVEDDRLKMTKVTGVLPANTGVIVRAAEGTYTFTESDETPETIEGNLLVGTTTKTLITTESGYAYYVLAKKDGLLAMYKPQLDNGQFYNMANKAYLVLKVDDLGIFDEETNTDEEGGQLSNRLRFDFGGTTDIEKTMDNRQQATDIYDLHGRRITDTEGLKGIYIVNGRKVIFK